MATILEIVEQREASELIPEVTGELSYVKDQRSGESTHGPWTCQNATLKDSTGSINIEVWNKNDMKSCKGKTVTFQWFKNKKNKKVGIEVIENEWKGKLYKNLKISGQAIVSFAGSNPKQARTQPGAAKKEPQVKLDNSPTPDASYLLGLYNYFFDGICTDPQETDNEIVIACIEAVEKLAVTAAINGMEIPKDAGRGRGEKSPAPL